MTTDSPHPHAPKLGLIVAMGRSRQIGREGKLLWHLPEDLKLFKQTTMGSVILMGRKTRESLGPKPLPGRHSVILSREHREPQPGETWIATVQGALAIAQAEAGRRQSDIWCIGGAEIYTLFYPHADNLLITEVDDDPPADTYLPSFDMTKWAKTETQFLDAVPKTVATRWLRQRA